MKSFRSSIITLLLVSGLLASTALAQTKSPGLLLQEGLYAEQTEGNLDKAIEIYQQVIADTCETQRIAAQATYQLGMCYLKKNQKEKAADYFQQVVSNYPTQTAIAGKAKQELEKIKPSTDQDLQSQLVAYLFDLHRKTYLQAKTMGIKANTVAYIIDETFGKIQAGLTAIENDSSQPIKDEVAIGNFGSNLDIELYNESLQLQKSRFQDSGQETGRYRLMWTPDNPVMPGEIRVLGYRYIMPEPLPLSSQDYDLTMSNYFGPEVLENLVVVLPTSIEITNGSTNTTAHQKIGNFDLYLWQKRVPANTMSEKKLTLATRVSYPDAVKPAVVKSFPETYANDIEPTLNEISVIFDQDMFPNCWSWCRTGSPEIYPQVTGTPSYKDKRNCVLPVKIEPAKAYLILINSSPYEGFKNTDMIPARPYAIVFATKDKSGNPTEIPADLLKKAQKINAKYAVPEPLLQTIPSVVQAYIANKFYETNKIAVAKGLRTNSHIHIIDEEFNRSSGGMHIFQNKTGTTIDHEIAMSFFDSPELYVFDDNGARQKIRMIKIPGSNYRMFWTPSRPVEPEEARALIWMGTGKNKLSSDVNQQYSLVMQNHFGSPVIEDFYVVLPSNIELKSQTTDYTSHEKIEGFDIYCWSQEQEANVNHRVDITLAKKK
jgi:hypothetical protein